MNRNTEKNNIICAAYLYTPYGLKTLGGVFNLSHIRVREILMLNGIKVGKKKLKNAVKEKALDKVRG